jgi:hypothetical protein
LQAAKRLKLGKGFHVKDKSLEMIARRVCELRGLNPERSAGDASGKQEWELHTNEVEEVIEAINKIRPAERIYKTVESPARIIKVLAQMIIGFGLAILLTGKAAGEVFGFRFFSVLNKFSWLDPIPSLQMIGSGLSYAAGIELAYMLYTSGPDEAVEPLILALSGAAMIEASKGGTTGSIIAVAVFSIVIVILFRLRERYIRNVLVRG